MWILMLVACFKSAVPPVDTGGGADTALVDSAAGDTTSPGTATDTGPDLRTCDERLDDVTTLAAASRTCGTAADCAIVETSICALGCQVPVRADAASAVEAEIQGYVAEGCVDCELDCDELASGVACDEGLCTLDFTAATAPDTSDTAVDDTAAPAADTGASFLTCSERLDEVTAFAAASRTCGTAADCAIVESAICSLGCQVPVRADAAAVVEAEIQEYVAEGCVDCELDCDEIALSVSCDGGLCALEF